MTKRNKNYMAAVLTISLLSMIALSVVNAVGFPPFSAYFGPTTDWSYTEVVIEPGDTLWALARTFSPQEDPRTVVGLIREINELQEAIVYPGQRILVPSSLPSLAQPSMVAKSMTVVTGGVPTGQY